MAVITVYSDITCPWAHVAVARLHRMRAELGLEDRVVLDHRAFPLEVFNDQPTPKNILDVEIPVAGALEPEARWQTWQAPVWQWPVTSLPAMEAVQAAKSVCSLQASDRLDRALRVAFFGESRCISMRHVILDVAGSVLGRDEADALREALDSGAARSGLLDQCETARTSSEVKGSPTVVLPDGTAVHNPGVKLHWVGEHGVGFPVVDEDDPSVYKGLLEVAASSA